MIRITAKPEKGFWRAGVHHTPEPKLWPDDKFDRKQLALLKAEPQLVVETGLPNPEPTKDANGPGEGGDGGKEGKGGKK